MMPLLSESFSHDLRPAQPFRMFAKRYTWSGDKCPLEPSSSPSNDQKKERYILICAHAVGFFKESYEPVLESMFNEIRRRGDATAPFVIEEAWALDCMNHGESGEHNVDVLRQPEYNPVFHTGEWTAATYEFIKAKIGIDEQTGRPRTKLIGVGHSFGGIMICDLAQQHPKLISSIMLLDPMLFPSVHEKALRSIIHQFSMMAHLRRDVWPNKRVAYEDLSESKLYRSWDPRSRALFVEHALGPHPASKAEYPFKGVTLRCTREQEAAICRGGVTITNTVLPKLAWITDLIPSYVVFGKNPDTLPRFVQDTLTSPAYSNFVQVTQLEDAGHLLLFEKPTECGVTLCDFIQHLTTHVILPTTESSSQSQSLRAPKEKPKGSGEPTLSLMPARL